MADSSAVRGIFSRTSMSLIGMAVQGGTRFIYTLAIGRFVGASTLGEVSALLSLAVFASLFWPAPAGTAASRFLALPELAAPAISILKRSFLWSIIILALGSAFVSFLLGAGVANVLGGILLVASYGGYIFVRGVLIGEDRITRATVVDSLTSLVALAILAGVIFAGWNGALLLPLSVSYSIFAVVSWPRGSTEATPDDKDAVYRFTRDTALMTLATGGLLPAVSVLVLVFDSAHVAGLVAAGMSLATPANQVAQALMLVLIPHFSRVFGTTPVETARQHRRLFLITAAGFTVVFALLIFLAPFLLGTFYGEEYVPGAGSMQMLMVGVAAMSAAAVSMAFLAATGHQRLSARIWLISLAGGVGSMVVLGPFLGQWGVLLGFLLASVGGSLVTIFVALLRGREGHLAS